MGAWGTETFANDDAMDWVAELQVEGLSVAESAVDAVLDIAPGYLDAPVCSCALAAAEVIAALHNRPGTSLPDKVTTWIGAHPQAPGSNLVRTARQAIEHILAESELRELWEESPEYEAWRVGVEELHSRLE